MKGARPYVLAIGGFDPSAGAGVLADVKTLEAHKVYGLAATAALTWQNDTTFSKVEWLPLQQVLDQINVLRERFPFAAVKIGLMKNLQVLEGIVDHIRSTDPSAPIVWDPVMKASSGLTIHEGFDLEALSRVCQKMYLVTPNFSEAKQIGSSQDAIGNAQHLSEHCNVFLKGGHNEKDPGRDKLFVKGGKQFSFRAKPGTYFDKHGSGCVTASAITANLAKGHTLPRACLRAKQYVSGFLQSNGSLLGYHK